MMMFSPTTQQEIARFQKVALLSQIGIRFRSVKVNRVSNFSEMAESIKGDKWSNYLSSSHNFISSNVINNAGYRFYADSINVFYKKFSKIVKPLARKYTKGFNVIVKDEVILTITKLATYRFMELEYKNYLPYSQVKIAYHWILKGHLPCGWDGDLSSPVMTENERIKGKLLVY